MPAWRVEATANGLRLVAVSRRAFGSEGFTWADLFARQLDAVRVFALFFPSRFDLDVDHATQAALESFGRATSERTSVNCWDPTDPEFSRALTFFDLKAPPAVVLATGHQTGARKGAELDRTNLYSITIADKHILKDRERLASAVNSAHEVLIRGDRKEIAQYVRAQEANQLLGVIARIAGALQDEILKLKPKFGLPGGVSIEVG